MARLIQVTDRVYLAGSEMVNWVLVADSAGVLLIDAGYPGDRSAVLGSLRSLGFSAGDVQAIVLTHAHIDHLGSAIWFAAEHGTPVYCHPDEVGHARRDYLEQASPVDVAMRLWRPRWARWSAHLVRAGGLSRAGIPSAAALTPSIAAELPGAPVAVPSPGHTRGHCSYVVDGVLASGDALVTGHPLLARTGPQLLPALFSHDFAQGAHSLSALALQETTLLAPGHGELWRGPIREAVAAALRV